uniref:Uncharacterized protein n=1 Tax=Kalanchoe fedtschenkoi TaxID=63787 RepID=A0A7N0U3D2_KALFE
MSRHKTLSFIHIILHIMLKQYPHQEKCSSRNMSCWLTFSDTIMPNIGITLNRESLQPFDLADQSPEDHPLLYKIERKFHGGRDHPSALFL